MNLACNRDHNQVANMRSDLWGINKVLMHLNKHGTPHFYFKIKFLSHKQSNRQSLTKILVQVLFQWNDLNHNIDLFFLHCHHVDFLTSPCRFQAPQEVLGLLASPYFLAFFFLFRLTDPKSGNVQYMTVNKKKRGWHNMYKKKGDGITCTKKRGWHYMYTVLGESGAHGHRYSATSVSIVI